ncbi:1970_t:CDS:1, partial [Funneliformis mosseae]
VLDMLKNQVTTLTRDKEVVAVRLIVKPKSILVIISKDGDWLDKDNKYIEKIEIT